MERRELLKMIALLTGGVVIGGEMFLSGCKSDKTATVNGFVENDISLLEEVAETILPKTNTPGAKDAAVGLFMTVMVNDCYETADQQVFHRGILQLEEACKKAYNESFLQLTPGKRHELLLVLDKEAKDHQAKKTAFDQQQDEKQKEETEKGNMNFTKEIMPAHYFTMMKQLTLLGFFTSKVGATEALRFVPVPGRYEGCIPYKKGDRAWA